MATILLSAAGAAVGGAFGSTALGLSTAVLGRAVGATLGRVIDQSLLGAGSEVVESGRLERYRLTGASEGSAIPSLYGRMRIGGQVIWTTRFNEHISTSEVGGKGAGGGATTREYSYSVSLAIAICQGEILRVGRIWADGMEIGADELDFRFYPGSQTQEPDPKIEAVEGVGNAPAYRGIAYVVLEDLNLSQFGNRVPQFSFEVIRATDSKVVPETCKSLSDTIRGVALIPGTGEYSLATTPVHYSSGFGWNKSANMNSSSGRTDFETSLDHLNTELPICDSVSLVVSWFGNDLRCAECQLRPKVEQNHTDGKGMPWVVSGLLREDADTVVQIDDRPVYGGTPADRSVIEAIQAIREKGKTVMFYPFILMEQLKGNDLVDPWSADPEQSHLPWRGRITTSLAPGVIGSPDGSSLAEDEVAAFFGSASAGDFSPEDGTVSYSGPDEWSYRRFILHYAHLCALAGGVDAFCIGSEMRGLTKIRGASKKFPAVQEFQRLAGDVRDILGAEVQIGYGADWSEYFGHHPNDGSGDVYFHLDSLWSDRNIDFIGIDNYMPISDWRDGFDHLDSSWKTIYNLEYLQSNICGGEGFDWYYSSEQDRASQKRTQISDDAYSEPWVFRYKDLKNWWSQPHYERIGGVRGDNATDWVPKSKPIWFTELGCAAVDKATNQPNKFVDPKSSESSLPYFSTGSRDDLLQSQYLRAMYLYWSDAENNPTSDRYDGQMVDMSKAHVWAWDARPFPSFPSRSDLWSDGANYLRGHWLNGRTTSEALAAVVTQICATNGQDQIDGSELYGLVRGYAIEEVGSARSSLQTLSLAYGFDGSESEGKLWFRSRLGQIDAEIDPEYLAVDDELDGEFEHSRIPAAELAERVRVNYVEAGGDFSTRSSEAAFPGSSNSTVSSSDLPICLTPSEGNRTVERWLTETRVARDRVRFVLPPSLKSVAAGDSVFVPDAVNGGIYRVDLVEHGDVQVIEAVRVERGVYSAGPDLEIPSLAKAVTVPLPVYSVFLDLPLIAGSEDPVSPRIVATANPWPGKVAVYSSSSSDGYTLNSLLRTKATVGKSETPLMAAKSGVIDRGPALRVSMGSGALSSIEEERLFNGGNLVAIGDPDTNCWEVFQFKKAVLVDSDTYELSERLRGQLGTDGIMPSTWPAGSTVVVLDGAAPQISLKMSERGLERHYLVGPAGRAYDDRSYEHYQKAFAGVGLRPYSPVHLKKELTTGGDLVLRWVRRTRIDGDTWESFEVPLGEASESYVVQVVSGETVLREAYCDSPTWVYPATLRAQDQTGEAITIRVAQISERFGPGPFGRINIDD